MRKLQGCGLGPQQPTIMGGGAGVPTNASGEVNRDTNVGAHD